jgi:hypothetical protein
VKETFIVFINVKLQRIKGGTMAGRAIAKTFYFNKAFS